MPWVLFWIFPVSLTVLWLIERYDRKTYQARDNLARAERMHQLDKLAIELLHNDDGGEFDSFDEAAWLSQHRIEWAGSGVPPMRWNAVPHTYPRRPARHDSHNRLHRGF